MKTTNNLIPLEYDGETYYVRLIKRGLRLDCMEVLKDGVPQDRNANRIRRVILMAKQEFEKGEFKASA